jgi:hypothetical protein
MSSEYLPQTDAIRLYSSAVVSCSRLSPETPAVVGSLPVVLLSFSMLRAVVDRRSQQHIFRYAATILWRTPELQLTSDLQLKRLDRDPTCICSLIIALANADGVLSRRSLQSYSRVVIVCSSRLLVIDYFSCSTRLSEQLEAISGRVALRCGRLFVVARICSIVLWLLS